MSALPDHIVAQARATDLTQLVQRYGVALRKESAKSWAGPCPQCGGDDRFWISDNRYKCRGCGISGDAIEFIKLRERVEFIEAVCMLTQYQIPDRPVRPMPERAANVPPAQPAPKRQPPTDRDIAKFSAIADDATHALFTDPNAEAGREYLLSRGIEAQAWERFGLGFRRDVPLPATWSGRDYVQPRQPAIVIPWYRGGRCMAIRYRFLTQHEYTNADGKETKAKQTAQPGSYFENSVYGAHVLPSYAFMPVAEENRRVEQYQTLVICEGELNAISIWQTCNNWGWEVLSLGSESAAIPLPVMDYALHFGRVLIWMDKRDRAREEMELLGPIAWGINSIPKVGADGKPETDDRGRPKQKDANDLMREGLLGGFLAEVRRRSCKTDDERRAFRYALEEADERPPFLDAGARQVLDGMRT